MFEELGVNGASVRQNAQTGLMHDFIAACLPSDLAQCPIS